jgi:hypothetical protein
VLGFCQGDHNDRYNKPFLLLLDIEGPFCGIEVSFSEQRGLGKYNTRDGFEELDRYYAVRDN